MILSMFLYLIETTKPKLVTEGEYLINPRNFPGYTLARSGSQIFIVKKQEILSDFAYNTVPSVLVPTKDDPGIFEIKIAGRYLCLEEDESFPTACIKKERNRFKLMHNGDGTLSVYHIQTETCLSVGEYNKKNNRYSIYSLKCKYGSSRQSWVLVPVTSKESKNVTLLEDTQEDKPSGHMLFANEK